MFGTSYVGFGSDPTYTQKIMKIPDIAWPTFFDSYRESMLRVICPQNQGIFFFLIFRVGIHALEILDTPLLLNYTMIGHGVLNKTKVSDCHERSRSHKQRTCLRLKT